jgi:dUTP pyrophosphatase
LFISAPRSGLAWKNHLDVGAGVVDADYRGNVGVILFNHGDKDFAVAPGDRVAQLILQKVDMAAVVEVSELPDTARGEGGFGSTGVSSVLPIDAAAAKEVAAAAANASTAAAAEAPRIGSGTLLVKRLSEAASLPVRGSAYAAGFDLSSACAVVVPAHGKAIVQTDLAIATPLDCYARIGG